LEDTNSKTISRLKMKKKGKVLFIIHDVYQEDNDFPLGIGYLAAVLKKEGVDVRVCCQDVFHYSNEELAQRFLEKENYDLIGFGFLAARFKETVLGLCETINKHKKDAWLVLGGHGPAPVPEYVIKKTNADVITIGEAEETIIELLKCKLENGDLSKIKGIAYKDGDRVVINERRKMIVNLDLIPFPEWSLFPMEIYTNCLQIFNAEKNDKVLGILTSRGCINRCNFCYRMEGGIRFRSMDNIIEEINILNKKYGVTYFQMHDELFNYPKKRIFEFYQAVKKSNLKIKFSCNARVDIFDEELALWLKESGCNFLNFGFESADQKVLNLIGKNTTVEQNLRALEIAQKVGIGVGLNFIWGNKGDSEESLRRNVELIKKYNTYDQLRTIRPVTPYPGCDLYYEAIRKGFLSGPEDFFNKFKNSDLITVNFTDMPLNKCYELLFAANKDLITDHYMHTTKNMEEADRLINDFYELYFKGKTNFRGSRHYEKK